MVQRPLLEALGSDGSAYLVHRAEAAARLASLLLLQGRVEQAAALLRSLGARGAAVTTEDIVGPAVDTEALFRYSSLAPDL
ncbi:MAG: hypothetical protein M3337_07315 [Actinomycetota bacterium]|nr:hypothetical protein [Actinomycetota bacterium]